MKKPVRKRRGFADGGEVSEDKLNAIQQSGDIFKDRLRRMRGADALAKYPLNQPEGYPAPTNYDPAGRLRDIGKAKGGKVKKVVPAKRKRR